MFSFADFFISGSNYRFIVVRIEQSVDLIESLG